MSFRSAFAFGCLLAISCASFTGGEVANVNEDAGSGVTGQNPGDAAAVSLADSGPQALADAGADAAAPRPPPEGLVSDGELLGWDIPSAEFAAFDATYRYYFKTTVDDFGATSMGIAQKRLDETGAERFVLRKDTREQLVPWAGRVISVDQGAPAVVLEASTFTVSTQPSALEWWPDSHGVIADGTLYWENMYTEMRAVDASGQEFSGGPQDIGYNALLRGDDRAFLLRRDDTQVLWSLRHVGSQWEQLDTGLVIAKNVSVTDPVMVQPYLLYTAGTNLVRLDSSSPTTAPALVTAPSGARQGVFDVGTGIVDRYGLGGGATWFGRNGYLYYVKNYDADRAEILRMRPIGDMTSEHVAWLEIDVQAIHFLADGMYVVTKKTLTAEGEAHESVRLWRLPLPT